MALLLVFAILIGGTALIQAPVAARQATSAAGTPCAATSEEENEELVRHYLDEAYNQRNPDLAGESSSR